MHLHRLHQMSGVLHPLYGAWRVITNTSSLYFIIFWFNANVKNTKKLKLSSNDDGGVDSVVVVALAQVEII